MEIVGLDPYVGALHEPVTGRPSLVCDLEEEFRVPVVDAMVVGLVNKRVVRPEDFESVGEGQPVIMRREVVGILARAFEHRLEQRVRYPSEGRRLTYRQVIEHQVRACARYVLGKADAYEPFVIRG